MLSFPHTVLNYFINQNEAQQGREAGRIGLEAGAQYTKGCVGWFVIKLSPVSSLLPFSDIGVF